MTLKNLHNVTDVEFVALKVEARVTDFSRIQTSRSFLKNLVSLPDSLEVMDHGPHHSVSVILMRMFYPGVTTCLGARLYHD